MQGKKYHWTVSAGFSLADAANFFLKFRGGKALPEYLESFKQDHFDTPQRLEIVQIYNNRSA